MEKINEKCILISEKEYNELKNEIAKLKTITQPLKINITLTQRIRNCDFLYQYSDVKYSSDKMLDLSDGIKGKIFKIVKLFTTNTISNIEDFMKKGEKSLCDFNINLIKTNLLNNFKKENLSFLEKIVLNKTLSRINNAFNPHE